MPRFFDPNQLSGALLYGAVFVFLGLCLSWLVRRMVAAALRHDRGACRRGPAQDRGNLMRVARAQDGQRLALALAAPVAKMRRHCCGVGDDAGRVEHGSQIVERRHPVAGEVYALPQAASVLLCRMGEREVELAMTPGVLTGFLSWLESAPPGPAGYRVAS